MKNKLVHILVVSVATTFSAKVFAENQSIDAGVLQQQIQKDAPDAFAAPLPDVTAPTSEQPQSEEALQILIKRVQLQGVHLLDEHALLEALAPSLGKSYSMQGLQKLVDVVTDFYSAHGFIVQAYLPEQSIQEEGVLIIQVLEAKLGNVKVENKGRQARISDERAADYVLTQNPVGQSLSIVSIAKGEALLNDLSGIKASSALEAGEKEGETNVHLSLSRTSLIDARMETKNGGSRSTGVAQVVASVAVNSPFNMGDQVGFYGLYSEGSTFNQLMYSLPIGYRGLRLTMTANYLDYETIGKWNGSIGDAWVLGANLSYPIKRSQSTNANLTAGVEKKGYLNLVSNEINSSYQIQNLNLGGNVNHYDNLLGGGVTNVSGNLIFGHLDFSSDPLTKFQDSKDGPFTKFTFNVARVQVLPVDGFQLNVNLNGQLSADNLNSSEKFYLGGPNGVRAYPVAQADGSQGMLASIELQKQLPQHLLASVFFDAGRVQQYKDPYNDVQTSTGASNTYSLYGAGVGLKWNVGKLNLSGVVAWKLGHNPLLYNEELHRDNDGTDTSPRAWLNSSYSF